MKFVALVVLGLASLANAQLYAPPVPASSPLTLLPPVFTPPSPGSGIGSAPPAPGVGPSIAFAPAPLVPPLDSSAPLIPPAFAPAPSGGLSPSSGFPPSGGFSPAGGPGAFSPPAGAGVPALVYGPPRI